MATLLCLIITILLGRSLYLVKLSSFHVSNCSRWNDKNTKGICVRFGIVVLYREGNDKNTEGGIVLVCVCVCVCV
jgi:hypothetical protein